MEIAVLAVLIAGAALVMGALAARLLLRRRPEALIIGPQDGERPTRPVLVDTREAYEKFKTDTQSGEAR